MMPLADEQVLCPSGEDDVHSYLREIRRYPLLTADEERALAERCAREDEDAIRQMVNSNLRLVVSVAREYAGRGVPMMDLIQEGSIGLLAAARKFDYTMDCRFSTYAAKWIRQGVTRCILNHSGLIRVPLHTGERLRKILAVRDALRSELEREPTDAEIGIRCDLPAEKVHKLLELNPQTVSLDLPTGENEDGSLGMLLEDPETSSPFEDVVREELNLTMNTLLSRLSDRQQQVLRLHFGMEDGTCHSLDEIGKILGVSKERARQIERRAMELLHELGSDLGLEDFLNE